MPGGKPPESVIERVPINACKKKKLIGISIIINNQSHKKVLKYITWLFWGVFFQVATNTKRYHWQNHGLSSILHHGIGEDLGSHGDTIMEFPLETLGPEQELTRVSPILDRPGPSKWSSPGSSLIESQRLVGQICGQTTTTTTKRLEMRRSSLITFLLLQPVLHFPVPTKHHLNLT